MGDRTPAFSPWRPLGTITPLSLETPHHVLQARGGFSRLCSGLPTGLEWGGESRALCPRLELQPKSSYLWGGPRLRQDGEATMDTIAGPELRCSHL